MDDLLFVARVDPSKSCYPIEGPAARQFRMRGPLYYLHPQDTPTQSEQILGARTYGMCMMIIGIFTLAIAAWQYRRQMKAFRGLYPEAPMSLSLIVAALIATLGILAFFAAIFRV